MHDLHTQSNAPAIPSSGFIRESELLKRIPVSHATLWRWVRDGRFPSPVKFSERITVWRLSDVAAWEAQQGQA